MGDDSLQKQMVLNQNLSAGWEFKQTDSGDDQWLPVASVPTVVHLDLLHNNKIPDPFVELNELATDWVGEQPWTYRVRFSTPETPLGHKTVLVFEGLDTYASVSLNGQVVLESENMFLSHTIDVTNILNAPCNDNQLRIDFEPALLRGRKLQSEHPEYKFIADNGDVSRMAVRKAQYHWGWDWGPVLMCCGPWRPVRLQSYRAKIDDLWSDVNVDAGLGFADGTLFAHVDGPADQVRFVLRLAGHVVFEATASVEQGGAASVPFRLDQPRLWFPHGYGDQVLYDLVAEPLARPAGTPLGEPASKRIGLRRAELVRNDDKHGRSFYFRINNIDVFCGGSCWIPADTLLPRIAPDRYRKWLRLMVDGGQVMTRVWGGGIYEEDVFYDTCDELGILVWQDFMFACGSYPTWPALLESIEQEARCNIRRLRAHPSIVLYAGNNEDYQIQETYQIEYDAADKDPASWLKLKPGRTTFPARYIYEHLLPKVLAEELPRGFPYWPSSPFSGDGRRSDDPSTGDVHEWNVWHGTQRKYQVYASLGGRFNSEFGLEALPHLPTIEYFAPKPSDRHSHSRVLDFHNKADGQERRLAGYLAENFRPVSDLEEYVHITQTAQADAMAYAYVGWRRQWGQDRKCGGALVWQLNDSWPCTSWAIVDYFLRKKAAYYAIARALKPIAVGIRRAHHDWSTPHARPPPRIAYDLWISSIRAGAGETAVATADVELRFVSIATGLDIAARIVQRGVRITANGTTEVLSGEMDADAEPYVLAAKVLVDGVCVAQDVDWPQPLKYLSLSAEDRGLEVTPRIGQEGGTLVVSAQKPVKGFVFEERDGVTLSDSAFSIVPGDDHVVQVTGLSADDKPLGWWFLGQPSP